MNIFKLPGQSDEFQARMDITIFCYVLAIVHIHTNHDIKGLKEKSKKMSRDVPVVALTLAVEFDVRMPWRKRNCRRWSL
jgi:hypothetical protein